LKFDPEVNPILDFIKSTVDPVATRKYAFEHGVQFYNRKKYFEAHEIFEFQWKKESGRLKIFIQALIQISVAMNKLYVNINLKGAISQAKLALEKILNLRSSNCFTLKGKSYSDELIQNLQELIFLLEPSFADISNYSPPKLLSEVEELFL